MTPVVLVAGTRGLEGLDLAAYEAEKATRQRAHKLPWWDPQSDFGLEAAAHGVTLIDDKEPFFWSTALDGLMGENVAWYAGGAALRYFCHAKHPPLAPGAFRPVSLIAHSHGGQVALYAAAQGLVVDILVTVGTPVRADMEPIARRARPHIGRWVHLYSEVDDWQATGALFDGRIGVYRTMDLADVNVLEPGVSHTALLDPRRWTERQWWDLVAS